jgi:ribokinase
MDAAPHVVVVGSVMTDMTVSLDRVPAAGETLVGRSFLLGFGGKGANQAAMAALLGAQVSMVACVGADSFGAEALENLRSMGIDTRGVRVLDGAVTGVAPIWVEASGENRIVIVPGANSLMTVEQVEQALDALPAPDVVICQLEIPLACVRRALELGRELRATTILNPAPFDEEARPLLELADWVTPNEIEFEALSGILPAVASDPAGTLDDRLARAGEALGCSLLMTHGERGALLSSNGHGAVRHLPAPPAAVLDTSGAGDAFVGAFATSIARGDDDLRAAEIAVHCASLTVEAPGTQASFAQAAKRFSEFESSDAAAPEGDDRAVDRTGMGA